MPDGVPNLGLSPDAHWFLFSLKNSTQSQEFILTHNYPPLDYLDLFIFRNGNLIKSLHGGELQPLGNNAFRHRTFNAEFTLETGLEYQFLVLVRTESSVQLPLVLYDKSEYLRHSNSETAIFYFYYGLMFVMLLYNLFLFATTRDRVYAPYLLYLVSIYLLSGRDEWLRENMVF